MEIDDLCVCPVTVHSLIHLCILTFFAMHWIVIKKKDWVSNAIIFGLRSITCTHLRTVCKKLVIVRRRDARCAYHNGVKFLLSAEAFCDDILIYQPFFKRNMYRVSHPFVDNFGLNFLFLKTRYVKK